MAQPVVHFEIIGKEPAERAPSGLVVGHFTDPEGNLIGVAGLA
jgi:hypothetical protein